MAAGQAALDPVLALAQPVEHVQQFIARDRAEGEQAAQRVGGRVGAEAAGGGELGIGLEQAGADRGQGEAAGAGGVAMQQAGQLELAGEAEQGGNMAVGQGASDRDGLVEAGDSDAALQDGADAVDGLGRELGKVGDGLAADALALAPGLAEQDGRGAVAIGDGLDVEGHGVTWKQKIPDMILVRGKAASQPKDYMETEIHL